ncbi:MAG: hypothetical protein PUP92_33705 [Rhizonema sp. PD38]|nr:hypothetical protein [Rhizonema sp. PD38]
MNKMISWLRSFRPLKAVTVFLLGTLLLITQACSSVDATTPPSSSMSSGTPRQIKGPQSAEPNSEVYSPKGDKVISPAESGINNFSDTDPRSPNAETSVKAKSEFLKEKAERNIQNATNNIGEAARRVVDDNHEGLGKNLQRSAEGTADKAQDTAEDFAKGTKRGIENIKNNVTDAVSGAAKDAKISAEDAKYSVQRTADDAGRSVNRAINNAGEDVKSNVKDTSDDLTQKGKSVIDNVKGLFKTNADEAAKSAKTNLDKANDAVEDAVDD